MKNKGNTKHKKTFKNIEVEEGSATNLINNGTRESREEEGVLGTLMYQSVESESHRVPKGALITNIPENETKLDELFKAEDKTPTTVVNNTFLIEKQWATGKINLKANKKRRTVLMNSINLSNPSNQDEPKRSATRNSGGGQNKDLTFSQQHDDLCIQPLKQNTVYNETGPKISTHIRRERSSGSPRKNQLKGKFLHTKNSSIQSEKVENSFNIPN